MQLITEIPEWVAEALKKANSEEFPPLTQKDIEEYKLARLKEEERHIKYCRAMNINPDTGDFIVTHVDLQKVFTL